MSDAPLPVQTEVCPVCRTVHDKPLCSDKRRYVKFSYGGSHCIVSPEEATRMAQSGEWDEYELDDVWMTADEFDALPEFGGF